ncbi:MAG: helix-turn-helix transcriptional regulator [Flavobacteriales bacterium]|nr:helix-turn-helix transcriptional regulator [Flavobacteriales bacterium]
MRTANTSFPDLLREHREAAGLTLQEVADKLHTDFSLVSKWERGARKPAQEDVTGLARVLKADRKQLLVAYLRDKVMYEVQDSEYALEALKAAEAQVKYKTKKR